MGSADITLRHFFRRHAEAVARTYVPGRDVEVVRWADTQVTAVEQRLDKTLLLLRARRLHALALEIAYRYERDLPDRVHEYQGLSRMAFRDEHPRGAPPLMESVVILLTGRRSRWPRERALRTSWHGRKFSGTRFRIDAVYQRTVAQLAARGSPFWLAFTPLARDATPAAMRKVVAALHAQVPGDKERTDLFAALLVLADVDPWGHNLREEIQAMLDQEPTDMIQVSKTLRDVYNLGARKGIEKGIARGIEKGIAQGIEKGIEQLLRDLFATRLHRALTAPERKALATRAAQDPKRAQRQALALEGEALAAWLLAPRNVKKAPPRKAARSPRA
jgi:hypothetical protein